jgi:hypothetical protein
MGPGEAQAHFFTTDVDRAKQALTKLGKAPKAEAAFWVEDADKIGQLPQRAGQARQGGHQRGR